MSLAKKNNQRSVTCLFVIYGIFAINTPTTTLFDMISNLIIPQAVAAQGDGAIYFIYNNHLGTPTAMINEAEVKVWSAEHKPFGKATVNTGVDGDNENVELNARFPEQYYDDETGLHYNYFRYYNPSPGRYMASDSIGLSGGLNTFGYVGGNPVNYIDPTGEGTVAAGVCILVDLGLIQPLVDQQDIDMIISECGDDEKDKVITGDVIKGDGGIKF